MSTQSIRRFLVASGLLVGVSAAGAPLALAQVTSGDDVGGTVDPINTVAYTAPLSNIALNPTSGNTGASFGDVTIQNNNAAGWTLAVKSLNGSQLKNLAGDLIAYTNFNVAGGPSLDPGVIDVSLADTFTTVQTVADLQCADSTGCAYTLTADIASTAIDGKPAGTYNDTITFQLTSN